MKLRILLTPIAAVAVSLSVAACDDDSSSDVSVADAWIRQPAAGQANSAAYGVITNDGDAEVVLVGASVPFDATVEIHETVMDDDGTMMMQEREEGFAVGGGESFTLEPGGPHVMLLDVDPADITGEIDVTFEFDDGTEVTAAAEVRDISEMDMDDSEMDMDDSEMDMDDSETETTDG